MTSIGKGRWTPRWPIEGKGGKLFLKKIPSPMHLRSFKVYPPYHSGRDNAPRPCAFPPFLGTSHSHALVLYKKNAKDIFLPPVYPHPQRPFYWHAVGVCWREEPARHPLAGSGREPRFRHPERPVHRYEVRYSHGRTWAHPHCAHPRIPPLERLLVRSRGFRGLIDFAVRRGFRRGHARVHHRFRLVLPTCTRVDASLFELLGDPDIAGTMVWESYPVVWITFGLIVVTALYALFFGKTLARHEATPRLGWKGRTGWSVATFVILFLLGYGQISSTSSRCVGATPFSAWTKHLHPRPEPHPEPLRYGQRGAGDPPGHRSHPGKLPPRRGMAPRTQPRSAKLDFMRTVPGIPGGTAGKAAECGGHHHGIHDMAAHVLLAQPDRHSRGHHAEPDGLSRIRCIIRCSSRRRAPPPAPSSPP